MKFILLSKKLIIILACFPLGVASVFSRGEAGHLYKNSATIQEGRTVGAENTFFLCLTNKSQFAQQTDKILNNVPNIQ